MWLGFSWDLHFQYGSTLFHNIHIVQFFDEFGSLFFLCKSNNSSSEKLKSKPSNLSCALNHHSYHWSGLWVFIWWDFTFHNEFGNGDSFSSFVVSDSFDFTSILHLGVVNAEAVYHVSVTLTNIGVET